MTILLSNTTFWDVVWWIIIAMFWILAIWVFISVFADIFRRHDIGGWAKAGWFALIFIVPFLGALIYIIARPKPTEAEVRQMRAAYAMSASGPAVGTQDIAKAHELLQQGALTQAEFDEIKARALA